MSGTVLWSKEDDIKLWALRTKPTSQVSMCLRSILAFCSSSERGFNFTQEYFSCSFIQLKLAVTFGRNNGGIRSRLKHLQNPEHKAYMRLHGGGGGEGGYAVATTAAASALGRLTTSSYASSVMSATGTAAKVVDLTGQDFTRTKASSRYSAKSSLISLSQQPFTTTTAPISSSSKLIDPSTLNADQKAASDYIFSGGNAFLTGAAGVGKSYLLNYLIQGLRQKYNDGETEDPTTTPTVVVAAATGIAATHINGVTIHSWAGVQLGVGGAAKLVPRVMNNHAACQRWRKARVLLLDEVSMIDGMLFDALDAIGKEVRGCFDKPFGGIQLILSGDFFQLPPVSLARSGFAFETPAWKNASIRLVELRTVVRQSGDCKFINLLNRVRVGLCPRDISDVLDECHVSRKALPMEDGILPTKLYCTNRNVDVENDSKLRELPGVITSFTSFDDFKGNYGNDVKKQISLMMDKKCPSVIHLKVGAQVILTRNMPDFNLVNGSRGVVASFDENEDTILNNNNAGSTWCSIIPGSSGVHQQQKIKTGSSSPYPIVHFSNGVEMKIREETVFQGGSLGAMTRRQLPLKLAWSLTVHKSQGMTIERAELQLDDAFDYGQVYVALSRITSLDGLWVRGGRITQSVVKAHPKVALFYQQNGGNA